MTRKCEITGKRPMVGNTVSHANNKSRRRFLPNLHVRRLWVEEESRFVTLRLSARAIRIVDKIGVKAALERMKGKKVIN